MGCFYPPRAFSRPPAIQNFGTPEHKNVAQIKFAKTPDGRNLAGAKMGQSCQRFYVDVFFVKNLHKYIHLKNLDDLLLLLFNLIKSLEIRFENTIHWNYATF